MKQTATIPSWIATISDVTSIPYSDGEHRRSPEGAHPIHQLSIYRFGGDSLSLHRKLVPVQQTHKLYDLFVEHPYIPS